MISKHTAFIAIDEEQKEPVKGSLQTWDVVANHPVLEPHKHRSTCTILCAQPKRRAASHSTESRSRWWDMNMEEDRGSASFLLSE